MAAGGAGPQSVRSPLAGLLACKGNGFITIQVRRLLNFWRLHFGALFCVPYSVLVVAVVLVDVGPQSPPTKRDEASQL